MTFSSHKNNVGISPHYFFSLAPINCSLLREFVFRLVPTYLSFTYLFVISMYKMLTVGNKIIIMIGPIEFRKYQSGNSMVKAKLLSFILVLPCVYQHTRQISNTVELQKTRLSGNRNCKLLKTKHFLKSQYLFFFLIDFN